MRWVEVLIALVVITGWVIANFGDKLKPADKPDRPQPPPLPPPERDEARPPVPAPARAADNLQDFLNEVRRRKSKRTTEAGKREEPLPAVLVEERPRRSVETLTVAPPPLPRTPPPLPSVMAPTRAAGEPGNTSRWTEPPSPLSLMNALPVQAHSATQKEINAAVNVPAIVARKPGTNPARHLYRLLSNPQSLATAFLVREVLDVPLCKRPRRRR